MSLLQGKLSQSDIYHQLLKNGSKWLKSHVLYADRKVVVLNKPAGLVCQLNNSEYKLKSERGHTFLNPVFEDIRRWLRNKSDPHPVHRLDKLTTGCFLVPITHSSTKSLASQFEKGTMKKTYLALVRGGDKSFATTGGEIIDPILYSDGRGEIDNLGKRAVTRWKLVASSSKAPVSLLELDLVTGNKHQLRIHLAKVLKTPILGDALYSRKAVSEAVTSLTTIPDERLFLHSASISFFQHHSSGRRYQMEVTAPLPKDFLLICDDLGISIPPSHLGPKLIITDNNGEIDTDSTLRLWSPGGNDLHPARS